MRPPYQRYNVYTKGRGALSIPEILLIQRALAILQNGELNFESRRGCKTLKRDSFINRKLGMLPRQMMRDEMK